MRDDSRGDIADAVTDRVDATRRWERVADAVNELPQPDTRRARAPRVGGPGVRRHRGALGVPIGTVRSRLDRARTRLRANSRRPRRRTQRQHPRPQLWKDRVVNDDDFDPLRRLQPDRIEPDDPGDPAVYARVKEQIHDIDRRGVDLDHHIRSARRVPPSPYNDELAAVDYLTRVFGFAEQHKARMEFDGHYLCWLRIGNGMVMLGHANAEVHRIHSPVDVGLTTVIMHVYVHDIDSHYAHAVAEHADVTMELRDAFYGDRLYEATDPEGHRWHFGERFESIVAHGGHAPEPEDRPE